jgi:hypothetical protein
MGLVRAFKPVGVVQRLAIFVDGMHRPVGCDPGIKQTSGLQRRFEAGALTVINAFPKFDKLPQRCARPIAASLRGAVDWYRRCCVNALFEALTFGGQSGLLLLEHAALGQQGGIVPCQPFAGGLLCHLQRTASRVVAVQVHNPSGQRIKYRRMAFDTQLLQSIEMGLPCRQCSTALLLHARIGVFTPRCRLIDLILALIAHLLLVGSVSDSTLDLPVPLLPRSSR